MTHSENVIYINKTRCHVYQNYINKIFRATKGISHWILRTKFVDYKLCFYVTFPITLYFLQWFPTKKIVFGSETFACLERILNPRTNPLINFSELIGCLV